MCQNTILNFFSWSGKVQCWDQAHFLEIEANFRIVVKVSQNSLYAEIDKSPKCRSLKNIKSDNLDASIL